MCFDADDPMRVATFWAELLGRDVVDDGDGLLVPGDDTQVGLRFVAESSAKTSQNPVHLHLTSTSADDQQRTVDAALRLGGRHTDVGQRPDETHIVLADVGGNEWCVIEPGNRYLAGCGPFGEVTCSGSRRVGLFWRDALDWPLVWDRDEETAIQSPHGGTKISWGGETLDPSRPPARQRLELETTDLPAEVERLIALGATWRADGDDHVVLTDPDGNDFWLRAAPQ